MPLLHRHTRPRWPPSPLVEDEPVSLSRELHGLSYLGEKPGLEGVCARGTIDQYPVLLTPNSPSSTPPPLVPCAGNCSSDEGNGPPTPPIDARYEPFFASVNDGLYESWPMSPRTTETPSFGDLSNIISDSKRGYTSSRSSREQLLPAKKWSNATPGHQPILTTIKPKPSQAHLSRESRKSREQSPDALSFSRKMEDKFRRRQPQRYSRAPRNEEQSSRESLQSAVTDSAITPLPRSIKVPGANGRFFITHSASAPQSPTREYYRMATPRSSRVFDFRDSRAERLPASTPQLPRCTSNEIQPASVKRTVSLHDETLWIHAAPGRRFEPKSPWASPRASPAPSRRGSPILESKRPVSPKTANLSLPPCPRTVPMAGHHDWSTIRGLEHLNICPTCTKHVTNSKFRNFVVPSVPKPRGQVVGCSFSDPWSRMAWLQTIKEGLNHLDTLADITRPSRSSVCRGRDTVERYWYKVVDPETEASLPGFNACSACVRNLKILMPSLSSTFKQSTVMQLRKCAFDTENPRFVNYIDLLDLAANRARKEGTSRPNIHEFLSYAKRKTAIPHCRRDRPALSTWHYIPQLPEFIVCEDCYDDVVWRLARADKPIARKVSSTPRLLPGNDRASRCREATCQLYSPRMRTKFRDAVQKNDFGLLKAAVLRRHDAEQVYQTRRFKLLERSDRGYDVDLELRRNKQQWREYE